MKPILTTREVAELLGVETWRVQRVFEHGDLPEPARFGGRRAIQSDSLPAIVDALLRLATAYNGGRAMTADTFLSVADVAKQLGVAPGKVRGWIDSGELIARNLASTTAKRPLYRIDPADLQEVPRCPAVDAAGPETFTALRGGRAIGRLWLKTATGRQLAAASPSFGGEVCSTWPAEIPPVVRIGHVPHLPSPAESPPRQSTTSVDDQRVRRPVGRGSARN